jgi:hypothetical protein
MGWFAFNVPSPENAPAGDVMFTVQVGVAGEPPKFFT